MSEDDDWLFHIAATHYDRIGYSLCGDRIGSYRERPDTDPPTYEKPQRELVAEVFVFLNLDHWFHNASAGGRLVGCQRCVAKIAEAVTANTEALKAEGKWDAP